MNVKSIALNIKILSTPTIVFVERERKKKYEAIYGSCLPSFCKGHVQKNGGLKQKQNLERLGERKKE